MITWLTSILDKVGDITKPALCHNNNFSDFWYDNIYGYVDCTCCIFWRGAFIGSSFTAFVLLTLDLII